MGAFNALFGEDTQASDNQSNIVAPKKSPFANKNQQIQPEKDDLDELLRGSVERNKQKQSSQRSWTSALSEGFKNLGTSAAQNLQGAYQAVTHPLDTASGFANVASGAFKYVMPFVPSSDEQVQKYANMVDEYSKKYGTTEGLKESIATDPIGTVLNLAPIGAPVLSKATAAFKGAGKYIPKVYVEPKPSLDLANTSKFQSGGAAATPLAHEFAAELHDASPEIKQAFSSGNPELVNPTNLKVIKNHNQFAKFDMLPTEGQALEDAAKMSEEANARREDPHIRERYEERDQKLIDALNNMRDKVGGEAFENNREKLADYVLTKLKNKFEAKSENASQLWKQANKAAGESVSPIDIGALQLNIENGLKEAGRARYLPDALKADLEDAFAKGYLTPQEFENFRSDTAAIQRKHPEPFARQAAAIVRDKLENVPIRDEFAQYKPLYDAARKATSELKADEAKPFYAAAISDNRTPQQLELGISHPASKTFFDKHYGANTPEPMIDNLINELGRDTPEHQALNRGAFEDIKEKVGLVNDQGIVKQANINNILYSKKGYGNRLPLMFGNEVTKTLKDFADVARKSEPIKGRHFVNTSNTAIVENPGLQAAKETAKNITASGVEHAINAKAGGIPVGTVLRNVFKGKKEAEAAAAAEAAKHELSRKRLSPTAGLQLKDIGKEQK
jgi:hypothetical protein